MAILTWAIQGQDNAAHSGRLLAAALLDEGVVGVAGDSFEVLEDTGSNLNVRVGSGTVGDLAVVQGDSAAGQGVYVVESQDATDTVTLSAGDNSDPRLDLIVLRVQDDEADSGGENETILDVVEGTPASVPAAPALPDNCLLLAEVEVPAQASAVTDSDITDMRVEAAGTRVPAALDIEYFELADIANSTGADTWITWGSIINFGNPGRAVKVLGLGSGSILGDSTLTVSARLRVAISFDGSTYTTGQELWIATDNQAGVAIRRGSSSPQHYRTGTPSGNVLVKLEYLQSGGSTGDIALNEGSVSATMIPTD